MKDYRKSLSVLRPLAAALMVLGAAFAGAQDRGLEVLAGENLGTVSLSADSSLMERSGGSGITKVTQGRRQGAAIHSPSAGFHGGS